MKTRAVPNSGRAGECIKFSTVNARLMPPSCVTGELLTGRGGGERGTGCKIAKMYFRAADVAISRKKKRRTRRPGRRLEKQSATIRNADFSGETVKRSRLDLFQ